MHVQIGDIVEEDGQAYVVDEDEAGLFFLIPLIGTGAKAAANEVKKGQIRRKKREEIRVARTRAEGERKGIRIETRETLKEVRGRVEKTKIPAPSKTTTPAPSKGTSQAKLAALNAKMASLNARLIALNAKSQPAAGFVETAIGLTGDIFRVDPHPVKPHPARMRVVLNVHGGQEGLADVMEGLVLRNMRSIRSGAIGRAPNRATDNKDGIWRDAVSARRENLVSPATLAAWKAAEQRVHEGDSAARVCFEDGRPAYVTGAGDVVGFVRSPSVGVAHDHGRSNEFMVLAIDDDSAYAVRDVNTAIAKHNARRMRSQDLPLLYESGVRYQTEGSPELWWDAEEILSHGHDDCEGLAAYRAGELINAGHEAEVYTRLINGPASTMGGGPRSRLFHAVTRVRNPNGSLVYDDPSMVLGMPTPTWYMDYAAKRRAKGLPL